MTSHLKSDLQPVFQVLEEALTEENPWFGGKEMAVSDFNMSWGVDVGVQRGYCNLAKHPKLKGWYERIQSRSAWKKADELSGGVELVWFGMKGKKVDMSLMKKTH